jgi:hypothetical protein
MSRPVISVYICSENFSHSAYGKREAKMAEIDVQIAMKVVNSFNTISPAIIPGFSNGPYR